MRRARASPSRSVCSMRPSQLHPRRCHHEAHVQVLVLPCRMLADKDPTVFTACIRRALASITIASCFSVLASCTVLGLLTQAALRGAGFDPIENANALPKPRYGRQLLPQPQPQPNSGALSHEFNSYYAGTASAKTHSHSIHLPIITDGELATSDNGSKASTWRIEGRGGTNIRMGAHDSRALITFPAGYPLANSEPHSVVLISNLPFHPSTQSLSGVFNASADMDSLARAQALRVQFGCRNTGDQSESWYGSVLLHSISSSIPRGIKASADVPLPSLNGTTCASAGGFDRIRIVSIACDRWGHASGQKDCDPMQPPQEGLIGIHSLHLSSTPSHGGDCAPLSLLSGIGWSCELEPSCPLSSLYSNVYITPGGLITDAREYADSNPSDERLVPDFQMGTAQGIRCQHMLESVRVGCLLSRGLHTHKAVHAGLYNNPDALSGGNGSEGQRVVIKQGGIRFPPPRKGERSVGFDLNETREQQLSVLSAMFFEQMQEILALEHLGPHPGIPKQLGACIDYRSMVATSIQSAAQINLSTKKDLKEVCMSKPSSSDCAYTIANSTASLFRHLTDDLHYGADFTAAETQDAAYSRNDVSQFALDGNDTLNLVLIDIDKLSIEHNPPSWFVQEYLLPFVAQRLYEPLLEFLPGLEIMYNLMVVQPISKRPTSFLCLERWFAEHDARTLLASGSWPPISHIDTCPSESQMEAVQKPKTAATRRRQSGTEEAESASASTLESPRKKQGGFKE